MNYGYFSEKEREYVVTRPDTPAPWANYLGSPEYGAIISNNAGGYSFVKSGANGRILRYRFNFSDQPGRYLYLRDRESGDYWSGSWQPVGKPLDEYQSECRHGTAYTVISSLYSGIKTKTLYYVPLGKTYEVWRVRIENNSGRKRSLSATGYAEFTNENNYEQDGVNIQYTQFITRTYFRGGNMILQTINENCHHRPDGSNVTERFFAAAGTDISSYCGDRDEFIGRYHSYADPAGVTRGSCGDRLNYNGNSCGALQTDFELEPGEAKEFCFLLGAHGESEARRIAAAYADPSQCDKEWLELKRYWHAKLDRLEIHTPDKNFDNMVNTWNAYQCFITLIWSRAASFVYCGLRNGLGYRDAVQDIQGITHLAPDTALENLRLVLSGQVDNGAGLPLIAFDHRPGHVLLPGEPGYNYDPYRSDDALWLFPTVWKYVCETGNSAFLDETIPFANKGEASVYEHLKRAIHFSLEHSGTHGLPAGLHADWNDCLRMGEKGETVFVAFQLFYAMRIMKELARHKKDTDYEKTLEEESVKLKDSIRKNCWEGDQFIRGIRDDGEKVGSKNDPEANLWLNPQSWSVISGCADREQGEKALNKVADRLNTEYGAVILDPPYRSHAFPGARMLLFNPSTKENGGIFCHNNPWIIIGEVVNGRPDDAFAHYKKIAPSYLEEISDIHRTEPYVYAQMIAGKEARRFGEAKNSWLTGTAAWNFVALSQYICGIRPEYDGLRIEPRLPSSIKHAEITRIFRGTTYHISVENKNNTGDITITVADKNNSGSVTTSVNAHDACRILGTTVFAAKGTKDVYLNVTAG